MARVRTPSSHKIGVPAKAGTHPSVDGAAAQWGPAFAGTRSKTEPGSLADLVLLRGELLGADKIVEFGRLRLEMQLDRADRSVALLGDDDVGHAERGLAPLLPAVVAV